MGFLTLHLVRILRPFPRGSMSSQLRGHDGASVVARAAAAGVSMSAVKPSASVCPCAQVGALPYSPNGRWPFRGKLHLKDCGPACVSGPHGGQLLEAESHRGLENWGFQGRSSPRLALRSKSPGVDLCNPGPDAEEGCWLLASPSLLWEAVWLPGESQHLNSAHGGHRAQLPSCSLALQSLARNSVL